MDIVFDVGGTSLRAANYLSETHEITDIVVEDCPNHYSNSSADIVSLLLKSLGRMAKTVGQGKVIRSVTIGFPGPVSSAKEILAAPTVLGGNGSELLTSGAIGGLWPNAVFSIINDVTAAGYHFVAQGLRDFLIVNVGSGIGSKLFIDGNPILVADGIGGELGHLKIDSGPTALRCDCGGRGHLGAIASGRGVVAVARQRAEADPRAFRNSHFFSESGVELTSSNIVRAYEAEDPWTAEIVHYTASKLARAISTITLAVGVTKIVLVGGFADALGENYRSFIQDMIVNDINEFVANPPISVSNCEERFPCLLGAGSFMLTQREP